MKEDSLKHFYDALMAARAICTFTQNKSLEDYESNEMLSAAVERKFEIIGEALNRIRRSDPEDLNAINEWSAIIGFRNILAHGYDHVESTVVWGIIESQLPSFIQDISSLPEMEMFNE